ncbi:MAG: hypothetical protein DIU54_013950 [Acidobacteriota bacterium]|jgi:hypothetical protein|nr:MAG: hypothetical protein DIU54_04295 [Acidobacteriota bacterium]
MSDTKPHATPGDPVEHDAVNFGALGWFVVILTGTVLVSQLVVWGLYEWYSARAERTDAPRPAVAGEPARPAIDNGGISTGTDRELSPGLLVDERAVLQRFLAEERRAQQEYGWIDEGLGIVRLPIERAKELVLERGLPVRQQAPSPEAAAEGAAR